MSNLCTHNSLRFEEGGYYIVCDVCHSSWAAVIPPLDRHDPTRRDNGLGKADHRVKPPESNRSLPKVSSNETTRILRSGC